jgi:hypothetical protein
MRSARSGVGVGGVMPEDRLGLPPLADCIRELVFGLAALIRIFRPMARLEEIIQLVERRLEELLEESTRLRAALEALGCGAAPANRRLRAGRTAPPVVKTLSHARPVKPTSGSAVTLAEPNVVDGDDATQDTQVERAVRQLRQELAAGLRGWERRR